MWEQLKRKFKQLLADEEPETETIPQEKDSQENSSTNRIHTKVSYQYPKNSSFKFPVIPDMQEKGEGARPAYERRKPEKKHKVNETSRKDQDLDVHRPVKKQQNKGSTKVEPAESKQPFKLTEVPSPIYGFRQVKKDTDTPAFLRKQKEEGVKRAESSLTKKDSNHAEMDDRGMENPQKEPTGDLPLEPPIDSSWEAKDAELEKHLEQKDITIAEAVSLSSNVRDKENSEAELTEVSGETVESTTERAQESSYEKEKVEEQEKLTMMEDRWEIAGNGLDSEKMEEPVEQTLFDEKQQEQHTDAKEPPVRPKTRTPFNVIMTPRDKRNRFRKERKEETSVEKEPKGPPGYLLNDPVQKSQENRDWVNQQIELLETTLAHFHVKAKVVNAMSGPAVTRFEVQPELGVKVSKIKNLSDDIKLNMAARDIRMEAPIPGKNAIGIEVPNPQAQAVGLQEIFSAEVFRDAMSPLSVALGLDIAGKPIVTDLQKMPHGLIAGATGSGKSVCINTILISLLYKASHKDVRFLLIDPKMVELAPYNELPHLVSPVITDVKAATSALKWAVNEMEERYEKFVKEGVRDVERYNQKMKQQQRDDEHLPYLVIVIDELADLMMVSPQDVEDAICRIAQKARACGMHLLLATQRPSVDVITGLIKANIPTRIAFSVSSQVDSRTIIDTNGAEKLLGRGDMLFLENGSGQSVRIQGAFVSDEEIERVTNYVRKLAPTNYLFEQEQLLEQVNVEEEEDELFNEAVAFVLQQNGASASLLQRRFKIGYNRAARLIDYMESHGIISEQKGSKPRDVLISSTQAESYLEESYK
ncbi:DNA translocase FtsK [Sediminibacillus halophilus]|uniref:DNA segregation ATPase FtsK/SpoIIIE, S-DNA-T family n=1 Tax=Sediminibacillus halophilus TaxID=482461 RepID=A0A1G9Y5M8_9BACI|nr:DNA translocase FtsK [Sediminibacillus halophilus]SDN03775.1 DNA segregation ATPase FtsK/SpoIIIE, S-DNA-T family [Sediminibacillus halophilus]